MRMLGLKSFCACLVGLTCIATTLQNFAVAQVVYSVKELPPVAGYVQSEATAINERGDVVGNSNPATIYWNSMGTRWVAGRPTALGINKAARDFQYSTARSINRTGLVVGESDDGRPNAVVFNKSGGTFLTKGANNSYALFASDSGLIYGYMIKGFDGLFMPVVWSPDPKKAGQYKYTELKYIDSTGAFVEANMMAANNAGQSVGYAMDSQLGQVPVVWEAGALVGTRLPADPNVAVDPVALNDLGIIVGQTGTSEGYHPIMWSLKPNYEVTHLPLFDGEVAGGASGINNNNIVIGYHSDLPAVWINGQIQDVNLSLNASGQGWVIEKVNDINDSGVIVGSGLKNGVRRAVMLTPVAN